MIGPYHPGPNTLPDLGIYTGDCRRQAEAIPDTSIDAIITDPVYDRIDDYAWLGHLAMRVLRPDRPLLVFNGIGYLPAVTRALQDTGLTYRWQFSIHYALTTSNRFWKGYIKTTWMSLTWWDKGKTKLHARVFDCQTISGQKKDGDATHGHPWEKGSRWLYFLARAFAHPDGVTLDPFTGTGSVPAACARLGRPWLAFEIDPALAAGARTRVAAVEPYIEPPPEVPASQIVRHER
jgi:DNA modification methylase